MTKTDNRDRAPQNFLLSFNRTISIQFVRQFNSILKEKGFDTDQVQEMAGISSALLEHPNSRVTPQQFSEYIRALVKVTGDEFCCWVSIK